MFITRQKILLLLVASPVWPQPFVTLDRAEIVISHTRQSEPRHLAISLRNTSSRDITYIGGTISTVTANGSRRELPMRVDLLSTYGHARTPDLMPHDPPQTLNSGQSFTFERSANEDEVINPERPPQVDTLIFADRSWWGDEAHAKRVFSLRAGLARDYDTILGAVRAALMLPDPVRQLTDLQAHYTKNPLVTQRLALYIGVLKTDKADVNKIALGLMLRIDESARDLNREHSVPGPREEHP